MNNEIVAILSVVAVIVSTAAVSICLSVLKEVSAFYQRVVINSDKSIKLIQENIAHNERLINSLRNESKEDKA